MFDEGEVVDVCAQGEEQYKAERNSDGMEELGGDADKK